MNVLRARFARHGLRCTKQRVALLRVLEGCTHHPTADELHQMLRDGPTPMSLATVYNALEAMCRAGLCRKLPTTSGSIRYDADITDHPHLRLRETGSIEDVPHDLGRRLIQNLPQDILDEIEDRMGVRIYGVQVQLIGDRSGTAASDRRSPRRISA